MGIRMSRLVLLASLIFAVTACGDDSESNSNSSSGGDDKVKWLSTGGPCDDLEMVRNNKDMKENTGFLFCGNAGHTFTGELRCERDFMEVQCR